MTNPARRCLLTTPIFYANSAPHVGHLYTALLADAQARWTALKPGPAPLLSTGTDEHGAKIQKRALAASVPPLQYCDGVSARFRHLFDAASVNYTDFVRTTEPRHRQAVEAFWRRLHQRGFLYKSTYEGWYSVNDECFLAADQVSSHPPLPLPSPL